MNSGMVVNFLQKNKEVQLRKVTPLIFINDLFGSAFQKTETD
jgi:hypothetical protein